LRLREKISAIEELGAKVVDSMWSLDQPKIGTSAWSRVFRIAYQMAAFVKMKMYFSPVSVGKKLNSFRSWETICLRLGCSLTCCCYPFIPFTTQFENTSIPSS
jgi:hypothetical protein